MVIEKYISFAGTYENYWKDQLERVQKGRESKARGLAVVIYNDDYREIDLGKLPGALKNGKAMMDTFKHLQFTILPKYNANKGDMREIFETVACYADYPEEYDCFAIVFAGRCDQNGTLLATDGEFNLERVIVRRLNEDLNYVSKKITKVPIIVFIDAQGGKKPPRLNIERIPKNMMLNYSSREDKGGGIWMQEIAKELAGQESKVRSIVASVKVENESPKSWNTNAGNITLLKGKHKPSVWVQEDGCNCGVRWGVWKS